MSRVLIVYGTTEGQTAKIAYAISDVGRTMGHEVDVCHAARLEPIDVQQYDGIIVGASVHEGWHQNYIYKWVSTHLPRLQAVPSAFFQVCLTSALRDEEHTRAAQRVAERLSEQTHWHPRRIGYFAGALRYSEYGWWKRFVLRAIARQAGGDTDTSRDYEYTDWAEVRAWAEEVFDSISSQKGQEVSTCPA